ncbi:hypothetical protein OAO87_03195 [bacterium]|nr:hypothetical protein [bacterium]
MQSACARQSLSGAIYSFMVVDMIYWVLIRQQQIMRPLMMVLHHLACLFGTLYAVSFAPRFAVPCFVVAIVVLELGSALANVNSLFAALPLAPASTVRHFETLFFVGMCASNMVARFGRSRDGLRPRTRPRRAVGAQARAVACRADHGGVCRATPGGGASTQAWLGRAARCDAK